MDDGMSAPAPLLVQAPRGRPLLGLAETRRPIVVVLGPQGCGTAVCAYALSLLGIDMTEIEPTAADRIEASSPLAQDSWERQPIRQFHDRILDVFNRAAAGPFYDFALPVAWWADPRLAPVRRDIAAFLEDRVTTGNFGFADPRTVRLLPLWQQVFAELRVQPKFVLCLRNPGAAAGSAHQRDGLDPEIAEYRWFVHMADFFRYAGKVEHCAIEYQAWRDEPSANLDRLQDFLGIEWLHGAAERELALAGVAALAGDAGETLATEPRHPMVRSFYRLARAPVQPGITGPREQIVQQFVAFQQLQRPLEKALAAHASAAAAAARERDGLAADCAALGAEQATARARLAEQDAALISLETRLDETESLLAAAKRERDRAADARTAEAEAGLAAAHSEAEALRGALAQTGTARDELQALVAAIRQELQDTRDAGKEQAAELRSARRDLAERDRANAAMRTELADATRARHDEADRRQALEREAAGLRDSLAASRQVGQAAMRALALAVAPAPPVERAGWLLTIRRRLRLAGR
jgi:hypothetical protein